MQMETATGAIYHMGLQHIAAVAVSLLAVYVGLRLSRKFGGSVGHALRWFCAGLFVITFPHTLEFFTVTFPSLPLSHELVKLLKAIFYTTSALLFLYSLYLLWGSMKESRSKAV